MINIKNLYPALYKVVPGWIKGTYHCVTAGTGVGKSKFAKWSFALWGYWESKRTNTPFKCLWFAREESYEKFWATIRSDLLLEKYGETITYYQLRGYHPGLTEDIKQKLDEIEPIINDMKKYIIVIDNISNPTGILKEIEKHLLDFGSFHKEEGDFGSKKFTWDNPDSVVIAVIDHYGLISTEPRNSIEPIKTTFEAIARMSSYFVDTICKQWGVIGVAIHQQIMTGDNLEHRKADLLVPTEDKLAGNKEVGRDYMYTWGLFSPAKYEKPTWFNYSVRKLGKHLTTLHLIKHRDGEADIVIPLYFHGVTNKYEELPAPLVKNDAGVLVENPALINFY